MTHNSLIIWGDSIAYGQVATGGGTPPTYGFTGLVTATYPGTVFSLAVPGASLHSTAPDHTTALSLAATWAALSPTPVELWLAMGANDYKHANGTVDWNPSPFGTAYADLVDCVHAALPNARVYVRGMIRRTSSGANVNGFTMADYEAQIAALATGRESWLTYVNALTTLSAGDLSGDGLHPNNAGHQKLYAQALAQINWLNNEAQYWAGVMWYCGRPPWCD